MLQAKIQESQNENVTTRRDWTEKTILDYWQDTVFQYPNREYITDSRGYRFTYGEIEDMSSRLASFLRETGVGREIL